MPRFLKRPIFWASLLFLVSLTQPYYRNLRYEMLEGTREGFLVKECDFKDITYAIYHGFSFSTQLAILFLLLLIVVGWFQQKFHASGLIKSSLFLYVFLFICANFSSGVQAGSLVSENHLGVGYTSYGEAIEAGMGFYLFAVSVMFTSISLFITRKTD
jgi:hypothetical protein